LVAAEHRPTAELFLAAGGDTMLDMSDAHFFAMGRAAARLLPLLTLTFLAACASPAAQAGDPPPAPVTAARAVARTVTEWNEFTGRLEAVHHVDVRPRVSGIVSSVNFTEGAIVRQGDLLFLIDPRPFQAEVDRLRAELQRAEATRTRTAAERDRAKRLAQDNAISAEESDRRVAAAAEADAQVNAVQAALRAAELNLEFTRVIAPISGRVGHAIVTEGNLVSTGPGEATLLTTLVSLDPIYASFEVDEPTYLAFRQGAQAPSLVRLALSGDEGFPREGRVDFVDNQLDPATGTIRVRAVFPNKDRALTPGLFVRLQMPGRDAAPGVLIRDEAVGTDLDKRFVYVVGNDQTIAYRPVTLGPIVDGLRVVRSGVTKDDLVVTRGLQRVRPGVKVTPELESMETAQ
jgi:membrane fusion protein, multidrug efflux system